MAPINVTNLEVCEDFPNVVAENEPLNKQAQQLTAELASLVTVRMKCRALLQASQEQQEQVCTLQAENVHLRAKVEELRKELVEARRSCLISCLMQTLTTRIGLYVFRDDWQTVRTQRRIATLKHIQLECFGRKHNWNHFVEAFSWNDDLTRSVKRLSSSGFVQCSSQLAASVDEAEMRETILRGLPSDSVFIDDALFFLEVATRLQSELLRPTLLEEA
eukprot:TRINITY_DN5954_c0_g1_i1.p1 TRINITY_DN5954_c0_g1~~TRINITY_DN5954_c0_g1_i1.p1  ORF type:complete len:219 (-),score=22.11 TRINITY_DN5954_c0_g1_i1:208-864(-)